jgi:hypothetical protein
MDSTVERSRDQGAWLCDAVFCEGSQPLVTPGALSVGVNLIVPKSPVELRSTETLLKDLVVSQPAEHTRPGHKKAGRPHDVSKLWGADQSSHIARPAEDRVPYDGPCQIGETGLVFEVTEHVENTSFNAAVGREVPNDGTLSAPVRWSAEKEGELSPVWGLEVAPSKKPGAAQSGDHVWRGMPSEDLLAFTWVKGVDGFDTDGPVA